MTWWSGAQRRPISVNYSAGTAEPNRLLVVHVMQGSLAGTDSWFRNAAAQVSAHFGVGNNGTCYQWVSTDEMAWHCCNGNGYSIGVETEGMSGQAFTDAQIQTIGKLFRWAAQQYNIPMWLNTNPYKGRGLSWHGLGGAYFCGHDSCPGTPRVDALGQIVAVAKG